MSKKKQKEPFMSHLNPLAGGSFTNWARLLVRGGGVSPRHLPKALYVTASTMIFAPFRVWEKWRYGAAIEHTPIDAPPIFILGHWRTGTTFLHNLMSMDPRLGCVLTYQTIAPEFSLVNQGAFKSLVRLILPQYRPQDNVEYHPDLPQEEEVGIPSVCPYSFYAGYFFPRLQRPYFDRYVLFDGISPEEKRDWQRVYLYFLKKAAYCAGGKRLLLKNPVNTGRVKALLELFPDAKFLHIYRNPYVTYRSTVNLYHKMLRISAFQPYAHEEIAENTLLFFEKMMRRYFEQRALIPAGNLVEIRFEEFEKRPLEMLEDAYARLALPGFTEAEPRFRAYLATLKDYKKNQYDMDAATARAIRDRWGFAFDEWGYDLPAEMRLTG
ncbi:MAG TPA: sulfotransferase [Candidatus Hydrogenedentes bacterium]|nr:sulfotransferase [Candidatus Hydrogenedentota bacterium]HOS03404.1 sulfotransferase [Candidatus Hydrogenedentota bacterium]